jgi:hypothetical protein
VSALLLYLLCIVINEETFIGKIKKWDKVKKNAVGG